MKKQWLFLLFPAVFAASLFIILESGSYYASFYENVLWKGFWVSSLCEIFLVIFSIITFKNHKKINYVLKMIVGFLFIIGVGGASLNVVLPIINNITVTSKKSNYINLLKAENTESKESLKLLKGQRTNSAIQAKHQREVFEELKSEIKSENSSNALSTLWISLFFAIFLRFSVQVANIVLGHVIGVIYREAEEERLKNLKKTKKTSKKKTTKKKPVPKIKEPTPSRVVKGFKVFETA